VREDNAPFSERLKRLERERDTIVIPAADPSKLKAMEIKKNDDLNQSSKKKFDENSNEIPIKLTKNNHVIRHVVDSPKSESSNYFVAPDNRKNEDIVKTYQIEIDSRTNNNSSDYNYKFMRPIDGVNKIELIAYSVPENIYNVQNRINNTISYTIYK
jgi:hypothetical protein